MTVKQTEVYFWNVHGGEMIFKDLDTALLRAKYRGQSGNTGVSMWDIGGLRYFTIDI